MMFARLTVIAVLCWSTSAPAAEPQDEKKTLEAAVARRKVAQGSFEERAYKGADGAEIRYRWMPPAAIEEGKKYPLVLCLHGVGGNSVAPAVLADDAMRKKYPCFILYPDADGEGWASTPGLARLKDRKEMLPLVVEAVRSLATTEAIDPARIYVTGQSMGGVGSWGAAARYSDLFAAAVPVCGAWDVNDAKKMTIPIWAFHGDQDATVPVKFSRELTEAVTKAGGTAKYTEFAGVGHGSWGPAYAEADLWKWVFEQRKTAAP